MAAKKKKPKKTDPIGADEGTPGVNAPMRQESPFKKKPKKKKKAPAGY